MSLTETTNAGAEPVAPPAVLPDDSVGALGGFSPSGGRVLLVWDAPNLDMGLGSILGRRPTALERPRFDALGRWLLSRTAEISAQRPGVVVEPEATVFTNIAPGSADVVRPWVDALRNVGFAVFAKPKIDEDSDVD
ncbi:NYN domain-containing protein, partial [Mycobacterium kansasii]